MKVDSHPEFDSRPAAQRLCVDSRNVSVSACGYTSLPTEALERLSHIFCVKVDSFPELDSRPALRSRDLMQRNA